MDIREFVKERIEKNYLAIDLEKCLATIEQYKDIYPDANEMKRFFHYVQNAVGGMINSLPDCHDCCELLGDVKVRGKGEIVFYEFDLEENYFEWQRMRLDVYEKIENDEDLRLLNYFELSTMNMITDIFTKCKYMMYPTSGTISHFNKEGYGTDQDKQSFIKFLGTKFKENYTFKPVK